MMPCHILKEVIWRWSSLTAQEMSNTPDTYSGTYHTIDMWYSGLIYIYCYIWHWRHINGWYNYCDTYDTTPLYIQLPVTVSHTLQSFYCPVNQLSKFRVCIASYSATRATPSFSYLYTDLQVPDLALPRPRDPVTPLGRAPFPHQPGHSWSKLRASLMSTVMSTVVSTAAGGGLISGLIVRREVTKEVPVLACSPSPRRLALVSGAACRLGCGGLIG